MAQQLTPGPMQIQHGHNGEQVFVGFSRHTDHVLLSEPEAEAFMAALKASLEKLREHKAAGGKKHG